MHHVALFCSMSSTPQVALSQYGMSLGKPSTDTTEVQVSHSSTRAFQGRRQEGFPTATAVDRAIHRLLPRHPPRSFDVYCQTIASLNPGCQLHTKPRLSPRLGKVSHYSWSRSHVHASISERIGPPEKSQSFEPIASADV